MGIFDFLKSKNVQRQTQVPQSVAPLQDSDRQNAPMAMPPTQDSISPPPSIPPQEMPVAAPQPDSSQINPEPPEHTYDSQPYESDKAPSQDRPPAQSTQQNPMVPPESASPPPFSPPTEVPEPSNEPPPPSTPPSSTPDNP